MNIDYDQPIYFDSLMIPLHTLQHAEKSLIAQALQQLVIIDIFSLTKTHKTFIRINLSIRTIFCCQQFCYAMRPEIVSEAAF